jgi:SAM-dependent methyltransferase
MALFDVAADAYIRFMGRFSAPLAPSFADLGLADVAPTAPVLDVGCGPGMLTAELVRRQGEERVSAVDPEAGFVAATSANHPAADVRRAAAEALPYDDAVFGATLAQLVVHFMADPVAGLGEMARVTAPGGRVSACVWDHGGGTGPLSTFWKVVKQLDPGASDEGELPGSVEGDLGKLLRRVGLDEVEETALTVVVSFDDFETWWEPYTLRVGPAGAYVAALDDRARTTLVDALRTELGGGPFEVSARAWAATGLVPAAGR